MGRPPPDMVHILRQSSAAWTAAERALTMLKARIQRAQGTPDQVAMLRYLSRATRSLRAAHNALATKRRKAPPSSGKWVREPMWRCRYADADCGALVWESERRAHLRDVHAMPDRLCLDAYLGGHFDLVEDAPGADANGHDLEAEDVELELDQEDDGDPL